MKILIVGAGLSGSVIAERFANIGYEVDIIEKRDHIGGNCYDYTDENGIKVSKYGAHLFHTNNEKVWDYVNKFTKWKRWEHTVVSSIDNTLVPVPPNITTVNKLFNQNIQNEEEMDEWLEKEVIKCDNPENSEDVALSRVGLSLYEKIFKVYTYKQWAKYPCELRPSVLERIPVRRNFDTRYFNDKYQALPIHGYTDMFENMLKHPNINYKLNTEFDKSKFTDKYKYLFYTGPIDVYFDNLPKLEYRSIKFVKENIKDCNGYYQPNSVVNFTGNDEEYTRIVEYKHFLNQKNNNTTIVKEYTCDEGEPYYPVPSKKNEDIYEEYKKLAENEEKKNNVFFVGRLANYKYFNMDQAILNSLELFEKITK